MHFSTLCHEGFKSVKCQTCFLPIVLINSLCFGAQTPKGLLAEREKTVRKKTETHRVFLCGDEGDSYSMAHWFTCTGVRGTLKPG